MWAGNWFVNPNAYPGVTSEDADGWVYAFDWPFQFAPKKTNMSHVRTRRWERVRRVVTAAEFVDDLLMGDKYTREVILDTCAKFSNESGIINFKKVIVIVVEFLNNLSRYKRTLEKLRDKPYWPARRPLFGRLILSQF